MLVMNSDGMSLDLAILQGEVLGRPDPPINGQTIGPSDAIPSPPDLNAWKSFGACLGAEIEIFFPPDEGIEEDVERAKEFCGACAVREICLERAIENKEYGIWGGTSTKDRGRIRRQQRNRAKELP